mmetsp:Transcript_66909/g.116445  ORF Transcript_66909/g.116445 Transcript_66909/m.116445 type:complete len:234 (+) Transcript_66909:85-786(+)
MQRCECLLIAFLATMSAAISVAEQTKVVQDDAVAGHHSGPDRRTGLRRNFASELRVRQAPVATMAQVNRSSQNKSKPSSRIPTVVHNKSAGNGYEKGSPLYEKQESMTEDEKEIVFDSSKVPTKSKIVLSIINVLGLGIVGVDRCYMGHIGQGFIKALTVGGLGFWFLLDYFLILFNCLFMYKSIQVVGYHAKFPEGHIIPAFWITFLGLIFKCAAGGYKGKQLYEKKRAGIK